MSEAIVSEFLVKVDKTARHYGRRISRGLRGAYWDVAQPKIVRPVFIVGCSRAGTTVVYKTFSEAPELGTLQRETHDFWVALHPLAEKGFATHALEARDASQRDRETVCRYFYSQTGTRRFVDKNNQNGLCIPYLHALFPDAHFVYVKRSPGDNINSLIEGWGKPGEFATWAEDLPVEVRVDDGRFRRWCFFLFAGWRDYVARPIEDVCAAQYVAMNRAILDARKAVPPSQWTEIVYEDLVRDPVAGFRAAFQSAGLAFGARLEEFCRSVLGTPYNAFSPIEIDKWRAQRNRERIERVFRVVAPVAREMGYAV
jgi:hypothetical protein